jgi:hypothetical protein
MQKLIDMLKAAQGPSRELDAEIFITITPGVLEAGRIDRDGGVVGWWPKDTAYQSAREVPRYTASVDEAVKLIPEGLFWLCGVGRSRPDEPLAGATVVLPNDQINPVGQAEGDHLAVCICAAALEAREAIASVSATPN